MTRRWEVFILVLSIGSLGLLIVDLFSDASWIWIADTAICGWLLVDFFHDLYRTDDWRRFMRWGWIDFVSALPGVAFLRVGRLLRIVRIVRGVRSGRKIICFGLQSYWGPFAMALVCAAVFGLLGAVAFVDFEAIPFLDSLWLSFSTVLTGDCEGIAPATSEGRVVALVLMTLGKALVGLYVATLAASFGRDAYIGRRDTV